MAREIKIQTDEIVPEVSLAEQLQQLADQLESDRKDQEKLTPDVVDWFARTHCRIKDELERIKEQHRRRVSALEGELRALHWRWERAVEGEIRHRLQGTRKKSVATAWCRVGLRKAQDTIRVVDEVAAVSWLEQHLPDALNWTPSILKTPIVELIREAGEVPDGVEFVPEHDAFTPVGPKGGPHDDA